MTRVQLVNILKEQEFLPIRSLLHQDKLEKVEKTISMTTKNWNLCSLRKQKQ